MTYLLRKHFWVIFTFFFFLWPQTIHATDPPNLTSPADNSTGDKSPKLIWEYTGGCIDNGSCFRVEVDNSPDFSSPEKSTYTNSFSYSPQGLPDESWHWRVKAKDKAGVWSEWSKVYNFTTGTGPSDSPSQSVTPSATPQASSQTSASQKSGSSFIVKDIPSEVNSDQDFEATISLSLPDKANTRFYLKGAFKKSDSSNYFAESFVSGSWIKNSSSYSAQFKIDTDKDGKWEGKIKVRPDSEDSGFEGTGNYVFKVARYTDTGSGPSWSNELTLKINAVDIPEPSASEEPEAADDEEAEDTEPDITASLVRAAPSRDYEVKIASVAGEATRSDNIISEEEQTRVLEDRKINWLLIILGAGILAGGAGFTFYKIRKTN